MYRFKSIKYLATTGLISAILVIISLLTQFITFPGLKGIIQFSDGLYFALILIIKGPLMLFAGVIYVLIVDLSSGMLVFVPVSIIIRIGMYFIIYYLTKYITMYASYFLAALLVLIYPLYNYLLYGQSFAIAELIVDAVQFAASYLFGLFIYFVLNRVNQKSESKIWNDEEFSKYKTNSIGN